MASAGGRPNQKSRTRKDLLQAAARLLKEGRRPSLEEIAEAALVSRATAYRYFPGLDALLNEAAIDTAMPEAASLFGEGAPTDPVERLLTADAAVDAFMAANETALRTMLAHTVMRAAQGEGDPPPRQNRRTPLIEAALGPASGEFTAEMREKLSQILAVIIGTEGMVVFRDVLQVNEAEAQAAKAWAIAALGAAARGGPTPPS